MARSLKTLVGFSLSVTMACLVAVAMVPSTGAITCPIDKSSTTDTGKSTSTKVTWTGADTCIPSSGAPFQIGVTDVTCTAAVDATTCTFMVTITDNEDPTFSSCPENLRKAMPDFSPTLPTGSVAVTWDEPAASDNSGPSSFEQPSPTHGSGSQFPLGKTHVVYTARDYSGNTEDSCDFDVYVVVQPPDNHTYVVDESTTFDSITVRWPELEDNTVTTYYILHYQGDENRDFTSRMSFTTVNSKQHTYIEKSVPNLSPGQLYSIEVGSDQPGANVMIKTVQQWTKPSPPMNVVLTQAPPSSAQLSWTPSAVVVEQYRVTLGNGRDLGYYTKTTDRIMVDSLRPGTGYFTRVSAVVGSGDMRMESDLVSVSTTVPSNASQLVAYNYTESSIEVAWTASSATGNANEPYMLFIVTEGDDQPDENFLTVFPTDNIPAVVNDRFEGLRPNTEYHIRLISNLGLSLSTTQKTRPLRVANIRPTEVLEDSITLEWDPPTEGATDYSYEVYFSPSPGEAYEPGIVSSTSKVISSLTNGTEYFIRIVSIFEGMKSVPQTLMVTTGVTEAKPSSPLNIEALVVGIVLGAFVLLLVTILLVVCIKYRRLMNTSGRRPTSSETGTGQTNNAIEIVETRHKVMSRNKAVEEDNGDMYEEAEPKPVFKKVDNTSADQAYENTLIGGEVGGAVGGASKPPPVKAKPKF